MVVEQLQVLREMDYHKQLVFCYLTCERLYPNYAFFFDNFEFGNKTILREAIDFIFNGLLIDNFQKVDGINSYLELIDINTPFPHNFNTILASSALDSCTSILETLNFMLDKKTSRLEDISTFATDTVDMYIHDRDDLDFNTDPLFEIKILNDPLMQRELSIQKGIISYLEKIDNLEMLNINNLLNLQYNYNKSNIDLC